MRPVETACRRSRGFDRGRRRTAWRPVPTFSQRPQRFVEPGRELFLVFKIAIHSRTRARRAGFLEVGVEVFSTLAELHVVRVAKRADAEAQFGKPERLVRLQRIVQRLRIVGRFALAVRARDHQHVLLLGKLGNVVTGQVHHGGGEAALARLLRGALGETFGRSGLGAKEDRQWLQGRGRWGGREPCPGGHGIDVTSGKQAGDEAVQPGALRGAEGRGLGDDGDGGHIRRTGVPEAVPRNAGASIARTSRRIPSGLHSS